MYQDAYKIFSCASCVWWEIKHYSCVKVGSALKLARRRLESGQCRTHPDMDPIVSININSVNLCKGTL